MAALPEMQNLAPLLGIELDIVQAPIGGVASPELATAVAAAGGLGSLALTWRSPEEVYALVRQTRASAAGPINANFVLAFPVMDRITAALSAGAEVLSFFWGHPEEAVAATLEAGAVPIVAVGSVGEARRATECGAKAIVAQGREAGGHVRGNIPLKALLAELLDARLGVPVLAAGGIADRRGVAAAMALGADGVWVGTRFVATPEANAHPEYQAALIEAAAEDTFLSELFDGGWPQAQARTLRNSTARMWEAAGRPPPGLRPREGEQAGLRRGSPVLYYDSDAPTREVDQGAEAMALYAGEGVGSIDRVMTAAEVVAELAQGLCPERGF